MKKRTKFIGLEVILMSLFLIGYSVIDATFLADYEPVGMILSTNEYTLYFVCMLVLIAILATVPFLAGMYFQSYLVERKMKKLMAEMLEKNPALESLSKVI